MDNSLLEINNVEIINIKENNKRIVNIPSLNIKRGDSIFLFGANGTGKSTIIKALFSIYNNDDYYRVNEEANALLKSRYGFEIQLNNQEKIDDLNSLQSFAYVSQDDEFGKNDSIIKALEIQALVALRRLSDRYDDYSARLIKLQSLVREYALKCFDDLYKYKIRDKTYNENDAISEKEAIKFLSKKKARDCSGGQKRLISLLATLIKVIVIEPDLLVLDEPLNHLDYKNKKVIIELLEKIRKERENSVPISYIIVSHCLVFDFINESNSFQYEIVEDSLTGPLSKKIYHDCLKYGGSC